MKRLILAVLAMSVILLGACAPAPTSAPLPPRAPSPPPEVAPPIERVAATIDGIRFEPESTGQTAIGLMAWRNTGDATHDFDVTFYLISPEGVRHGPVQVEQDVRVAPQVSAATGLRLNFEGLPPGTYGVSVDVCDAQTGELVTSRTFAAILTLEAVEVVVPEVPSTPTPSPQMSLWTLVYPPGGGTISPSSGTQGWNKSTYGLGTEVTLTATPSPGYRFVSWSGEVQGTSPTITITMKHDWSVVANFEPISTPTPSPQMSLWTLVYPPGGGTVSPSSGTYDRGAMIYLIATPSPGYRFVSWSGDVPAGLGLSPDIWIPTDQDRTLQANFELISTPTPTVPPGVSVTLDFGRSASAPVSSEGAVLSVTTEDGINSMLTVPPSALLSEETITITPILGIQGLPIEGTFIGGIHMAPDGLQFSTPCTLEVELSADVGAIRLVGITLPAEGVGKLKPVEVRGSRAVLTIDHFSNAAVLTVDSMVDLVVHCEGGAEGQMIERDEYFESPRVKTRIRSGVEDGKEYEEFFFIETTGDPAGPHGKIWTYIDENGVEHSRRLQYNSDGSLSRRSDQIDGRDVDPSVLDSIFTADFATRGEPPEPGELAAALERLREKICGEDEEFDCTAIASISVSPEYWELQIGESKQLVLEVRDADGNLLEGYDVCWGSSDDNVASVDASGLVTGVAKEFANVGAKVCGEWGLALIQVIPEWRFEGTWEGSFSQLAPGDYREDCIVLTDEVIIVISSGYGLELSGRIEIQGEEIQGEDIEAISGGVNQNRYYTGVINISLPPDWSPPSYPCDLFTGEEVVGTFEFDGSGVHLLRIEDGGAFREVLHQITEPLYLTDLHVSSPYLIGGTLKWYEYGAGEEYWGTPRLRLPHWGFFTVYRVGD